MSSSNHRSDYDTSRIIAKCLYTGMALNVIIPVAVLFACYLVANNLFIDNRLDDLTRPVFVVFAVIAVASAGLAIWWRGNRLNQPLIRKKETFEADLTVNLAKVLRPVFLLIASICFWGFLFFSLTGFFTEAVFFVVFSFLVFQVVRPRYGFLEKVIARQEELIGQGKFYQD